MNIEIARNDIERSHRNGQSRQPGEKTRPIIVKFVRYNHRNIIFRNKKDWISKRLTASRMEELKEARELRGFRNVCANNHKIFCKLNGNDKPHFYHGPIILDF